MANITVKNSTEPATPSAGYSSFYIDSTTKNLTLKRDDGSKQSFDPSIGASFEAVGQSIKVGNPIHIDSLNEYINHIWSSGIVDGCAITNNGDGTVNIATGSAIIRAVADGHTQLYPVEVTAQTNIGLTDDATNFIYLDWNAGTPQFAVTTSIDGFNCLDKCLAYVVHRTGTNLEIINTSEMTVDSSGKMRRLFVDFSRFIHKEGGTILSEVGNRQLNLTAGAFYFMTSKIPHNAFNTSISDSFTYYYKNGIGGWNTQASATTISNTVYDNGTGTLAAMSNNKFRVDEVWLINDSPSKLAVVFGQAEYASLDEASKAPVLATIPNVLSGVGVRVGRVIVQKDAVNLSAVQSSFAVTFSSSAPTTHNDLAGLNVGEYIHVSTGDQTFTGKKTFDNVSSSKFYATEDVTIPILGSNDATNQSNNQGLFATGIYPNYAMSMNVSGKKYEFSKNALTIYSGAVIRAEGGSAALPVYSKRDDADTGIYFPALNQVGISCGGVLQVLIKTSGIVNIPMPTYADNAAAIAGGLVASDIYKTATGEVRIVV